MEQLTIRNLTFSYKNNSNFSLQDISFHVDKGEIFLIIGQSGSGKTTLLRHLKPQLVPAGIRKEGYEIRVGEKQMHELTQREQAARLGYVGQDVEACQCTDKVWHELAFGLENLGYSQAVMQRRVAEMTAFFGLEAIYYKPLSNLSGGQKQMVNLACVMAMEPEILILDEPTSQLDPVAALEFLEMLKRINRELGTTIIMTEHRLEDVLPICDRAMVLDRGKVLFTGESKWIVDQLYREQNALYNAMPTPARLYLKLHRGTKSAHSEPEAVTAIPLTVREGKRFMEDSYAKGMFSHTPVQGEKKSVSTKTQGLKTALFADELWFRYEKDGANVLKACSMKLEQGRITAILGGNGTGKSTFLQALAGGLKAYSGKVEKQGGKAGILPQNPQVMFTKKTVREELEEAVQRGEQETDAAFREALADRILQVARQFRLQKLFTQHPFDLSGGEMQCLGLAKLILEQDDILLLDEPGKGMDYTAKERMGNILKRLAAEGKTVLMVSHDVEFCARYADVCGLFFDGHIVSVADTRDFFMDNIFYTTVVQRMCKHVLPQAIIAEDVTGCGDIEAPAGFVEDSEYGRDTEQDFFKTETSQISGAKEPDNMADITGIPKSEVQKGNAKTGAMYINFIRFFIFFVIMPFTVYIGETFLHQRKYYFISLLLVLEAVFSFFFCFERRQPKLKEIMVVAMMAAITVAGRGCFYMLPMIKPVAALVILSGVSFGGETGFLVGSMSMLVSNIFFGQGPWTPWQMFAMGMLGLIAGIIFNGDMPVTKRKKWGISIYGFCAVTILYGGIMNTASVVMYQDYINSHMLLAALAAGLPFDLIHAGTTMLFLWIGTGPLLHLLGRVKDKYGFGM